MIVRRHPSISTIAKSPRDEEGEGGVKAESTVYAVFFSGSWPTNLRALSPSYGFKYELQQL